jgi:hypothetical protein
MKCSLGYFQISSSLLPNGLYLTLKIKVAAIFKSKSPKQLVRVEISADHFKNATKNPPSSVRAVSS